MMAQEHLSFKDIPIEESMTEFCQKLKAKGFTSIEQDYFVYREFYRSWSNSIDITTDDGKNAFAVVVLFGLSGEWNILVNIYGYYKNPYTRKYGKPTISKEKKRILPSLIPMQL